MILSLHNIKKVSIEHKESATAGAMAVYIRFTREDKSSGFITCHLDDDAEVSMIEKK